MSNKNETVVIPAVEYKQLLADSKWLGCLEAAGVDNWDGADMAREMMADEEEDEEVDDKKDEDIY